MKFPRKISFVSVKISRDKLSMPDLGPGSLVLLFCLVNIATWAAFWLDKRAAQRGAWRIPEKTLLGLTAAGGTIAAFHARHRLRHKTRKQPFSTYLYGIAACQIAFGIAVLLGENPLQYLG